MIPLYRLGHVTWEESQLIYHALPRLGLKGLLILSPATPYVCIGYHQDPRQEVDLDYCRVHGIPVFRREVGGGAVYLDGRQLFYQLVLPPDHPLASLTKEAFYRTLLGAVVATYGDLGVPCRYKPVNDIVTEAGRKISGNGAAHIANSVILVGNLIFDFDYETMVRVLRVPDEKYRDKVYKSMYENLTTMARELPVLPSEEQATICLCRRFEEVLGPMNEAQLPASVWDKVEELRPKMLADEWLFARSARPPADRDVRIAAGVNVIQRVYKAPGGLVRALLEVRDGRLGSVALSGDFFFYPEAKLSLLESALVGQRIEDVEKVIECFYTQEHIESPGLTPADWAAIISGRI